VGLYQLSNGKGGCSGTDRNDISKDNRACAWKSIKINKENFIKEFNYYEDWFSYGMHQQGLSGFKDIWRNRDKKFNEISQARQRNMNNNVPSKMRGNMQMVSDFIDYWKERINKLIKSYSNENNVIYDNRELTATAVDGPLKVFSGLLPELDLEQIKIFNFPIVVTNRDDFFKAKVLFVTYFQCDGLIGWDLLCKFDFTIDYKNKQLILRKPTKKNIVKRNL
jgi:hypothetical protein